MPPHAEIYIPPGNPPTNPCESAENDENKKDKIADAFNVKVIDTDEPFYDELGDVIDATPLARTSINESYLSTPDQEIFTKELDSSIEEVETDIEDEEVIKADQVIMNDL